MYMTPRPVLSGNLWTRDADRARKIARDLDTGGIAAASSREALVGCEPLPGFLIKASIRPSAL